MLARSRFAGFAWAVLGYNLLVIIWGAFVRATGSGAGCGSHWPLCNGEVIPPSPQLETLIEFTHRLTSGVALLLVLGLLAWAYRRYARGHIVRRGAQLSTLLIIIEALLGAGLVLFELVAHNASLARAGSMAAHLINTFLLIGALALTAWWASGGARLRLSGQGLLGWGLAASFAGLLLVGMTGAIIALGDTLFFAHDRAGGTAETLPALVAVIVQFRAIHPLLAVLVGLFVAVVAWRAAAARPSHATRVLAAGLTGLYIVQLVAGAVNVALQVPVWMQLIHLLLADLVWIGLVLLAAAALAEDAPEGAGARVYAAASR